MASDLAGVLTENAVATLLDQHEAPEDEESEEERNREDRPNLPRPRENAREDQERNSHALLPVKSPLWVEQEHAHETHGKQGTQTDELPRARLRPLPFGDFLGIGGPFAAIAAVAVVLLVPVLLPLRRAWPEAHWPKASSWRATSFRLWVP
jgi:hypothetical protein